MSPGASSLLFEMLESLYHCDDDLAVGIHYEERYHVIKNFGPEEVPPEIRLKTNFVDEEYLKMAHGNDRSARLRQTGGRIDRRHMYNVYLPAHEIDPHSIGFPFLDASRYHHIEDCL